jgi:anti-anti-sigma factor
MESDAAAFTMSARGDEDVVLELSGELDVVGASTLAAEIETILADRPERLLVDLADLEFLDSAGLATLVHGHNAAEAAGIEFVLASPTRQCAELLEITSLRTIFKIVN